MCMCGCAYQRDQAMMNVACRDLCVTVMRCNGRLSLNEIQQDSKSHSDVCTWRGENKCELKSVQTESTAIF